MNERTSTQLSHDETFSSICAQFPGEFLVLEVTEQNSVGEPIRARVLVHAASETEALQRAKELDRRGLLFFRNLSPQESEKYSIIM